MKEIIMVRTETMILQPGQIFALPDNIAAQIIRRGSGKLLSETLAQDRVAPPPEKKTDEQPPEEIAPLEEPAPPEEPKPEKKSKK
jgi:hypothetical protein